jgi:hypothetical protein
MHVLFSHINAVYSTANGLHFISDCNNIRLFYRWLCSWFRVAFVACNMYMPDVVYLSRFETHFVCVVRFIGQKVCLGRIKASRSKYECKLNTQEVVCILFFTASCMCSGHNKTCQEPQRTHRSRLSILYTSE